MSHPYGLDARSFSILDNVITELSNKVWRIQGVCDLIAFASDADNQSDTARQSMDEMSIHNAATMAREALNEVAATLGDLLAETPRPSGGEQDQGGEAS